MNRKVHECLIRKKLFTKTSKIVCQTESEVVYQINKLLNYTSDILSTRYSSKYRESNFSSKMHDPS